MKIIFNDKIQEFLDYCSNNNIELYLVGGALRDYLINKETYDYDFALTTNYEKAIEVIKNKYQCQIDKKYYSIKLRIDNYTIEITHARGENNYLDYRHPSEIELCSDIKEDSKRRDFTINALYYKNEKIYDFYNGIDDLKNNRLRVIGDTLTRFKEDPLRILRMIRFSCLGYSISVEDERIILDSNYLLKELSSFAFFSEFDKILQISNIDVLYNYRVLFEEYFELRFKDLFVLKKLGTLDQKKTYLGIKNKSNIFKYKEINISNDRVELTRLIYKLSKEIIKELVEFHDLVYDDCVINVYNRIIENDYYCKKQLSITSQEIIEITKKEELTSYYIDKISYSIINKRLKNKREEIIKYLMENA